MSNRRSRNQCLFFFLAFLDFLSAFLDAFLACFFLAGASALAAGCAAGAGAGAAAAGAVTAGTMAGAGAGAAVWAMAAAAKKLLMRAEMDLIMLSLFKIKSEENALIMGLQGLVF
jgi:hypothetical protein